MIYKMIAILSLLGTMDEKGWVSVEKPQQITSEQSFSGDSEEAWPVFIRQFGSDRVAVRFPNEPVYTYPLVEEGDLETMHIAAQQGENVYTLFVEKNSSQDLQGFVQQRKLSVETMDKTFWVSSEPVEERVFDLLYRKDEKWVRERVFMSSERFYVLQTISETLNEEFHLKFASSFDLEKRGENKVFHREFQS